MPTVADLIVALNGSKVNNGYHQMELAEESRYNTTFTTHEGLYHYKRLSFGINSAAEAFQKAVTDTLHDLSGVKCKGALTLT